MGLLIAKSIPALSVSSRTNSGFERSLHFAITSSRLKHWFNVIIMQPVRCIPNDINSPRITTKTSMCRCIAFARNVYVVSGGSIEGRSTLRYKNCADGTVDPRTVDNAKRRTSVALKI